VTAPLHKEGLRAAGLPYPGHTEILAERTGTRQFAMMLYCQNLEGSNSKTQEPGSNRDLERGSWKFSSRGLGVIHVTLHMALRDVFQHLSREAVLEKTCLLDDILSRLLGCRPRIGVA